MVKAYVLMEVEGREPSLIAKDLTNIEEVENVNIINGDYDVIALVKSRSLIDLKELALTKIGKIRGVTRTNTLIIADQD